MIPRSLVLILLVALALACFWCGNSNAIKVTGKLLQAGQPYVPPAGQRVVVTLYVVDVKDASGKRIPAQEPFHGYYDPKDGTFVVPGPDGHGIPPGQYRISIFQGLTREGESKVLPDHKGTSRKAPGNNRETDFFEGLFGPTTSPIGREVTQGAELIVDLDKEAPAAKQAAKQAETEKRKRERQQSGD
ncbi:MAG: hypothetical protein ACXWNX_06600 [Isosphaeraceae bacterium]